MEDDHLSVVEKGVAAVDVIDLAPFKTYHHTAQDTLDNCSAESLAIVGRVVLATLEELEADSAWTAQVCNNHKEKKVIVETPG